MADSGSIAVLVATAAATVAGVQAWIAHRKLKFDLFAKRFETYESFNDAITNIRAELGRVEAPEDIETSEHRQTIWRLQRMMRLLFPSDVGESVDRVTECVGQYGLRRVDMVLARPNRPHADPEEFNKKYSNLLDIDSKLLNAQVELGSLVTPYLRQYGWTEIAWVRVARAISRRRQ